MSSFIDYYAVLGVEATASPAEIKAAFKKLALRYHPDVYKGEDAEERMRLLLEAYQTLSDAKLRSEYDHRRLQQLGLATPGRPELARRGEASSRAEVSPHARRDRHRYYDFPALDGPATIYLGETIYSLGAEQATILREKGMLRGSVRGGRVRKDGTIHLRLSGSSEALQGEMLYCHRCHERWPAPEEQQAASLHKVTCPRCQALDWSEYLLLRCLHCRAVFESEQIRYEVGVYRYGGGRLCHPYELFPLCPYCARARWCPAEDERLEHERAAAARRRSLSLLLALALLLAVVAVLSLMALNTLIH
ncbi:J domain-containing protein [Thermogemmatispora sp.]|uniref:J domain-containing protein n=1 Tax=Thermogemmatispora sp. TaxID=1968838 RepID=UPI001D66C16D|nr:J domain-containing protein [Thermogemmatispora sp.]MBX5450259.1 J domain-containing protein [Thermogemmatispora sp.]